MEKAREINLIPFDVMMKEKARKRILIWVGMVPLFIMILSAVYVFEKKIINTEEAVIADLSLQKHAVEEKINRLNLLQEKRDLLAKKEKIISSLLNKRSLSYLFSELEKSMNKKVWLTSFTFEDTSSLIKSDAGGNAVDTQNSTGYITKKNIGGDNNASHLTAAGVTTFLRGMAFSNRDLADFLAQLSRSGCFSEVNLKYSQEGVHRGRSVVEFEIETFLKKV